MKRLISFLLTIVIVCLTGCGDGRPVTVRVLTYNIHHGEGEDGRLDLERIARVIERDLPDLVALQEVDRGVKRTGGVDQPARLAELTGMTAVFEKNIDLQGGEYGNAVLSRLPVERHENHLLPLPAPGEQRGLLEVHVRIGDEKLIFFVTHFDHRGDDAERLASVAVLRERVERSAGVPILVAGDFNATPDSRAIVEAAGSLIDSCAARGEATFTYPAGEPERRIDYVLCNGQAGLRCIECRVIPEPVASDHRPVLAVFELGSH